MTSLLLGATVKYHEDTYQVVAMQADGFLWLLNASGILQQVWPHNVIVVSLSGASKHNPYR